VKSALAHAKDFFDSAIVSGQRSVTNVSLQRYVRDKTGQSQEVVHGTLDCTGPGTLVDSQWYTDTWHKEKLESGRIEHVLNGNQDGIVQREMDFDYEIKRLACKRIMGFLPQTAFPPTAYASFSKWQLCSCGACSKSRLSD
jgi:hypothetical protein